MMKPSLPNKFTDINWLEKSLREFTEGEWVKRGEDNALQLFRQMSRRVPAYKDFLRKQKINPTKIKTVKDFRYLPTLDKNNYLRAYPLEQLCWDGRFSPERWVVSTTSGSTGEPFYFPRARLQNWQYAIVAELYLRANFEIHKKKTLYIIGFPMGAWIGGLFTYQALDIVGEKGDYPLSVITPGIHKEEIIKTVKKLGDKFDQVIIGSYGPFLKDTLDDGEAMGVNWEDYNLGFVFSAEGFTEGFRDYVVKKAGIRGNFYKSTLNHYGTVDLGTMSYETPFSILVRRIALKNRTIYKKLFGDTIKLPTLTQYIPELFYFEDISGNLLCSAYSGLPLVRYDLKDHGGIVPFEEVIEKYNGEGIDLLKEATKVGIAETVWRLPFVHVYERSDFSVSFYAFNIYPETIRRALQREELEELITGKFTMLVNFDESQNQVLEINVEKKAGVSSTDSLIKKLESVIKSQLLEESSEFRETYKEKQDKVAPKIVLWDYESPTYFRPGVKQKWVKK